MKKRFWSTALLAACLALVEAPRLVAQDLTSFATTTGARTTIDKSSNTVQFLRFPNLSTISLAGNTPHDKALAFINNNGGMLRINSATDTYRVLQETVDEIGFKHVTVQQLYRGVPVYDGLLKFHFTNTDNVTAINGNIISEIKLNITPTLRPKSAEDIALRIVDGQQKSGTTNLQILKNELNVYQKGLAKGLRENVYLVYSIEVSNRSNIREFIFIDAHSGEVVDQFSGRQEGLHRELYNGTYSSPNLVWWDGNDAPPTTNLLPSQLNAIDATGQMYHFMKNAFNRVSYDGRDAKMIITLNNPNIGGCPNASWDGTSANFCNNTASDDIVGHEWMHAYVERTAGLIYAYQPGALNESYSDIFGEVLDQINNYMDAAGENANRSQACATGTSKRWLIGENASAFGGAIRDMYNPNCYQQPAKVSDPFFHCVTSDGGGVHINSGVNNFAFALLVDGGNFNGQNIRGIGLTKATHIFWRALSHYLTATSGFHTQADALESAANDLLLARTNLPTLTASPNAASTSGQVITQEDIQELTKVLLAVEMRQAIPCVYPTILKNAPDLCAGATSDGILFKEDFENGLGRWTTNYTAVNAAEFTPRNWVVTNQTPMGHPSKAAFAVSPNTGNCTSNASESGVMRLESPSITIPANMEGDILMAFDHYISSEMRYDGGNIKYSINGGAWTTLPLDAFTANGYNAQLASLAAGNYNPLRGQYAFTGTDGSTFASSWGQSHINLSVSSIGLRAGQSIKLAWEFGSDICGGYEGWYIDNVLLYSCAVPAVHFVDSGMQINESEANASVDCLSYVEKDIVVKIDKAPSAPVTLTFTASGTATNGTTGDYTLSPMSVTLNANERTKAIKIRVYNDAHIERDEYVDIRYRLTTSGDAFAASTNQSFRVTITDNDLEPITTTPITVYHSNFDLGLDDWTISNGGNNNDTWQRRALYGGTSLSSSPFIMVDSDAPASSAYLLDETITSPAFNTAGMKQMRLSFKQVFRVYNGGYIEQALVQIWDGTIWRTLDTQNQSSGTSGDFYNPITKNLTIPDSWANDQMRIRFTYKGQWDYYWAIDDVKVEYTPNTRVSTNVGASTTQPLGPLQSAYFYGADGNVIARIDNNTNHNYGCTRVEILSNTGTSQPWTSGGMMSGKNFRITPTNNTTNGNFTVTLYYKPNELNGLNSYNSMGRILNGSSSSTATAYTARIFTTDYAFSATFSGAMGNFNITNVNDAALPVNFISFTGKATSEGNLLNWATASEVDNAYFEIERSSDGKTFTTVGYVEGNGDTDFRSDYSFVDSYFIEGVVYYRLKQVDGSGSFAYSKLISINGTGGATFSYYPNPTHNELHITIPNQDTNKVLITVFNQSGIPVLSQQMPTGPSGKVSLDIKHLPIGMYQVVVKEDTRTHTFTILKH